MNDGKGGVVSTPIAGRVKRRRAKSDAAKTPLRTVSGAVEIDDAQTPLKTDSAQGNKENAEVKNPGTGFILRTVSKKTKQELLDEINELRGEKNLDNETIYGLQLRVQGLEKEYDALRESYNRDLISQIGKLDAAIEGLNSQVQNEVLSNQITDLKEALRLKQEEVERLKKANSENVAPPSPNREAIKKRLSALKSKVNELNLGSVDDPVVALRKTLEAAKAEAKHFKEASESLQGLLNKSDDLNQKLNEQLATKQAEIDELNARLVEKDAAIIQLQEVKVQLENERAQFAAHLTEKEEANAQLVQINKDATALLEQRQTALEQERVKSAELVGQVQAQIDENAGLQRSSSALLEEKKAELFQVTEQLETITKSKAEADAELANRNEAIRGFADQITKLKQEADAQVLKVRSELANKLEEEKNEVQRLKNENAQLKQSNADVAAESEQRRVALEQAQARVAELESTSAASLEAKQAVDTQLAESQKAAERLAQENNTLTSQKTNLNSLLNASNKEVRASHDFAFLCLAGTACTILACAAVMRMNNVQLNISKDMLKALPSEMYKIVGEATSALIESGYKAVTEFFRG